MNAYSAINVGMQTGHLMLWVVSWTLDIVSVYRCCTAHSMFAIVFKWTQICHLHFANYTANAMDGIIAYLRGSSITWSFPSNSSCSHIKNNVVWGLCLSCLNRYLCIRSTYSWYFYLLHSALGFISASSAETKKSSLCSNQYGIFHPSFLALLLLSHSNISNQSRLLLSHNAVPWVSISRGMHKHCQCSVNRIQNEHMVVLLV